jgi:hypothetical protein
VPYGGQSVEISGLYRSVHVYHREHDGHHALLAGQFFPQCAFDRNCAVEYILINEATSVAEVPGVNLGPKRSGKRPRTAR